ncbi:MAG: hypothetical protein J0L76_14585 [Rhodobacterales bacterium]|nr:hypothetical protein [Rhodobacterales bacterium]
MRLKFALIRLQERLPILRKPAQFIDVALYSVEPFKMRAGFLKDVAPVENVPTYGKIADFILHRSDPARSVWYRDLLAELERTGTATHKALVFRTEAEIRGFLENYVGGLVDSMAKTGYDRSKAHDIGTAIVAADGSIIKSVAGTHRFSVARILGVSPVPLEILGAHEDWMRAKKVNGDLNQLRKAIREVETQNQ